jgi:hypothetical protein
MPHQSTGAVGFGNQSFGSQLLDSALRIGEAFLLPRGGGQAAPGGAPLALSFGDPTPGLQVPGTDLTIGGSTAVARLGNPFRAGQCGATATVHVVTNPTTGKATWFGPLGRPILWSRDLAVTKRVRKIARRAKRAGGR